MKAVRQWYLALSFFLGTPFVLLSGSVTGFDLATISHINITPILGSVAILLLVGASIVLFRTLMPQASYPRIALNSGIFYLVILGIPNVVVLFLANTANPLTLLGTTTGITAGVLVIVSLITFGIIFSNLQQISNRAWIRYLITICVIPLGLIVISLILLGLGALAFAYHLTAITTFISNNQIVFDDLILYTITVAIVAAFCLWPSVLFLFSMVGPHRRSEHIAISGSVLSNRSNSSSIDNNAEKYQVDR